jgi:hypothetical protein
MTKFETESHLTEEVKYADRLREVWWMYNWIKASTFSNIDYYVTRKEDDACIAYAELKSRNCFFRTYRSYIISAKKIDNMLKMIKYSGYYKSEDSFDLSETIGLIFIRYLDGDFYYKLTSKDFEQHIKLGYVVRKMGGRTKQTRANAVNDIEEIYHIDTNLLKQVGDMQIGKKNGIYKHLPEKTLKEILDGKELKKDLI